MKKWIIAIIVIALIGGGIFWLTRSLGGSQSEIVKTTKPEYRDIRKTAMVTGSIEPSTKVGIKSAVSGILDELMVSVGEEVKRGQKLARIQIVPDPEQINSAEREVEVAKLNLQQAKANFKRQKELYEGEVIAKSKFEEAKNNYEIQQRELKAAKERLEIIREGATKAMEETSNIIKATMDGKVLSIPVKEGSSVMGRGNFNEGTTIMQIADMENMVFQGQVGEADVAKLELGMDMELTIGALPESTYPAKLGFIAPKGQDNEGRVQFSISAKVNQKNRKSLRAGYSASADIIIQEKDSVLSVEERHLEFEEGDPYLMVKKGENEFEKQIIQTGISDGVYIEVEEGLKQDDEFKTGGQMGFRGSG